MEYFIFWTIYTFIIGLCVGSFLNVVVLRAFSGESIVLPPSHCTSCNHKLAWLDNIPVLSYIILRGKCRYCNEKISFQYPLVELFTGMIFAAIFYKFAQNGFSLNIVFLMAIASLMLVLAVTDIKEKVIFDGHTYILAIIGLVYNFFNFSQTNNTKIHFYAFGGDISFYQTLIYSFLGLIIGFCGMKIISLICKLITKKECFGDGDSYITASLGAVFGVANVIVIFILSILFWGLLCVPQFLYKLFRAKEYKLFSSLILFGVISLLFLLGEILNVFTYDLMYWISFVVLILIGFYCCRQLMVSIKTKKEEELSVLPFGPALIFSAFVVMFILGMS